MSMSAGQDNSNNGTINGEANCQGSDENDNTNDAHVDEPNGSKVSVPSEEQSDEEKDKEFIRITLVRGRLLKDAAKRNKYGAPGGCTKKRRRLRKLLIRLTKIYDLFPTDELINIPVTPSNMELARNIDRLWRQWKDIVSPSSQPPSPSPPSTEGLETVTPGVAALSLG
ncbi:hypothetical protein FHL15_003635 [Xylaria flabelliformis]|uniref:Uncharacterized protein n=1 Tax=Xylaria flabelliformis TaxID=2512241 RepID=A0A553I525_9PEZI|nr:hypothetical protein FHL15_003635 [Xylaria flabelliformis]